MLIEYITKPYDNLSMQKKAIDKIQHHFMIKKILNNFFIGVKGNYLNLIKAILSGKSQS